MMANIFGPYTMIKDPIACAKNQKKGLNYGHNNPFPAYLPEKPKNMYSQGYMHPYVHCSSIHGGQDMETTKLSFNRGLDKDVVHIYYGILRNCKKR